MHQIDFFPIRALRTTPYGTSQLYNLDTFMTGRFWPRLCQNVKITILVERLNRVLSELPIEVGGSIKNLLSFDD